MGLKLLYITNGINGAGGLERVLSIKASYFAEYGYEVSILALNEAHLEPFYTFSDKIQSYSITVGGNPLQYLQQYRKGVQNVVNTIQPDIILVCDDGLKGFFLPTIIQTKAKWIYERHVSKLIEAKENDGLLKKLATKLKWYTMEKLGQTFDHFVVLTKGNKKEWTSLKNVKVIPNPLSFYPERSSSLDQKVVICVGKISYQKGQDLLVQAWERIHLQFPDWQLHLYGKEDLSVLDTQNLSDNIHYFPPEKNIAQKYLESAIYVMSSRFEGFGMVLIEAMACGIPCVAFDCDYGPGDIITHQEDGVLVEQQNIKDLAEQILHLIKHEEVRKEMGVKAYQNVQRYQIPHIAPQWINLFNKI